ncbi:MAG: hypothetical protein JST44_19390 [Cyanobacteria bacterium SZAS LIN-5]|nr:hypothetical protein [Cyanobacteria bacterium SZAS LIN-5]
MTSITNSQISVTPMFDFNCRKTIRFAFAALLSATIVLPANAELLKGTVNKQDSVGGSGTTLNRNDIQKMGDPFGGGGGPSQPGPADQAFDPGNFQVSTMAPPQAPPPPLQGNAQGQGQQDFQGQYGQAMPAQQQAPQQMHNLNAQSGGPPPQQFNPNDPDSSPELQIAWNEWHRRVAAAVYERYSTMANAAFYRSPPMVAAAAYVVTRDGHIVNSHLTQKNGNPIFNAIVLTAINSLNGNMAILAFPPGSRRMTVDKSATFAQNYGPQQGFKYQMGDQETIRRK